jgi:hypothetical protein
LNEVISSNIVEVGTGDIMKVGFPRETRVGMPGLGFQDDVLGFRAEFVPFCMRFWREAGPLILGKTRAIVVGSIINFPFVKGDGRRAIIDIRVNIVRVDLSSVSGRCGVKIMVINLAL